MIPIAQLPRDCSLKVSDALPITRTPPKRKKRKIMRGLSLLAASAAFAMLSGCSTTQSIVPGPQAKLSPMTTACFTAHGGRSADMDAAVQRNLENHGVSVSIAPACDKTDMNVSYTDSWYWDVVMYLRSMDIRFYKAPSGGLIASGHWKNSVLHQFPNADGVVQDLMDGMFVQAGEPGAIRTKAASN
jgi:hypothetical protein